MLARLSLQPDHEVAQTRTVGVRGQPVHAAVLSQESVDREEHVCRQSDGLCVRLVRGPMVLLDRKGRLGVLILLPVQDEQNY